MSRFVSTELCVDTDDVLAVFNGKTHWRQDDNWQVRMKTGADEITVGVSEETAVELLAQMSDKQETALDAVQDEAAAPQQAA